MLRPTPSLLALGTAPATMLDRTLRRQVARPLREALRRELLALRRQQPEVTALN